MRGLAIVIALSALAAAPVVADDDLGAHTIVFTRNGKLIKSDARGRNETELLTLPTTKKVRALRSDAAGKILLADIGGTWSWMPLDGSSSTLTDLPCEAGPASLSQDGTYVLCRGRSGTIVCNLKSGKITPLDVLTAGARLTGVGSDLRLIWADAQGVWNAVPPQKKLPKKVAPQTPVRHLLASPDGTHAVGVYTDEVFEGPKRRKTADVLMVFALDGTAARRKAIQNGVPIEWSHDSKWVLIQDGSSACVMLAVGGQYKCWRGYTAQSLSPDGRYALLLGNRQAPREETSSKKKKKGKKEKKGKRKGKAAAKATEPEEEMPENEPLPGDEHGDEPTDDVPVPLPTGPLSLYRAELDGAFTKSPPLVARDVDGAAVWIP